MQPKVLKYRKPHKISYEGVAKRGTKISFGDYALQAKEGNWITEKQIEAARQAVTRYMKRGGNVWIRIFPHLSRTKKPAEVRMGSGKGNLDHFVAVVKKEMILFEVAGVSRKDAYEALRLGMHKLPVKCKIIERENVIEYVKPKSTIAPENSNLKSNDI